MKEEVDAYKIEKGCVDCGYREHPVALDFDHVGPGKRSHIGAMLHLAPNAVWAEIAKCEVRCANCHRIATHTRGYWNQRAPRD